MFKVWEKLNIFILGFEIWIITKITVSPSCPFTGMSGELQYRSVLVCTRFWLVILGPAASPATNLIGQSLSRDAEVESPAPPLMTKETSEMTETEMNLNIKFSNINGNNCSNQIPRNSNPWRLEKSSTYAKIRLVHKMGSDRQLVNPFLGLRLG